MHNLTKLLVISYFITYIFIGCQCEQNYSKKSVDIKEKVLYDYNTEDINL